MVEIHDLHVRFHGASREAVAGTEYVPDDSTDNAEANEQNGNYDDE